MKNRDKLTPKGSVVTGSLDFRIDGEFKTNDLSRLLGHQSRPTKALFGVQVQVSYTYIMYIIYIYIYIYTHIFLKQVP